MATYNTILTSRQSKFLASYQLTGNPTESAINAGYSVKCAPQAGSKLMRNPKIIAELDKWKAKKASEITKEDFIDKAMGFCDELETVEPNKPRFMDIAGKALGYIGASERANSTTNNVQINIALTGKESQSELWELTRKLLGA
jgi:hypothetical protein